MAAIAIVLAFLVWLLRKASRPDRSLLIARYREAYRGHACPVCAHPSARGPLRFAVWTRRGPRLPTGVESAPESGGAAKSPYTCPACGTLLFDDCARCGASRHTLLPFCESCGDERTHGALASVSGAG